MARMRARDDLPLARRLTPIRWPLADPTCAQDGPRFTNPAADKA